VRIIHTDDAPSHAGTGAAGRRGGRLDPRLGAVRGRPRDREIPEDARAEAEQLFDNLAAILAAAGCGLTDVVRVGIVMRDLQRDRPVFNEVWAERFGEHRPGPVGDRVPGFGRPGRTPGS
jgi:2-iminobutanoate/2-iminopropanoate deaminase